MNEPYPDSRRELDRVWHRMSANLILSDGETFRGETRDVSLHGMFLLFSNPGPVLAIGLEGRIRLLIAGKEWEFSCRVAHANPTGVGLQLHRREENFGQIMVQSHLGSMQTALGGETSDWSDVRGAITLDGQRERPIRILKLSSLRLDGCVSASLTLDPGMSVDLRLVSLYDTPLHLKAKIAVPGRFMISSCTCLPGENHFWCELESLSASTREALDALIHQTHESRLQARMKATTMTLSLFDEKPYQPPSRSDIYRDLNNFFGKRPQR